MDLGVSWNENLKEEIEKPYIARLREALTKEKREGVQIYPSKGLVFNAFLNTPYDQVRVVIVGQDPYHGEGQAHGLSFSVPRGVAVPPSLNNIFKELRSDLGIPVASHGDLTFWAKQGVLLLNATLTVRAGAPRSHYGKGWEEFTTAVIDLLAKRKDPLVFLLWGKSAQEKCAQVLGTHHAVFTAAHPSPYSATGFLGCRHFSQANTFLKSVGKEPIDWNLAHA